MLSQFWWLKETTMLHAIIRSAANLLTALVRGWDKSKLFFLSKAGIDKRASVTFTALQRKEMEAERLDRLRNPSNYQGR